MALDSLVTERLRPGSTLIRYTASKLLMLTNCVIRTAQRPTSSGTGIEYSNLRGEGLVWLIGATVCLLAATPIQLSVSVATDGWNMLPNSISSRQSSAASETVKRCWSSVSLLWMMWLSDTPDLYLSTFILKNNPEKHMLLGLPALRRQCTVLRF